MGTVAEHVPDSCVAPLPQGDTCCWICDKCEPYEFVVDQHTCRDCGHGSWPYDDKLSCYQLEVQYMKWSSPLSVGPIVIAVIGTANACERPHCRYRYGPRVSGPIALVSQTDSSICPRRVAVYFHGH